MKTNSNVLVFKADMEAGHGGASGRFKRLKKTHWNTHSFGICSRTPLIQHGARVGCTAVCVSPWRRVFSAWFKMPFQLSIINDLCCTITGSLKV
ncbi:hypothetical protein OH492_07500 [Vibrio chagasii]|nr:hypothetical protein [Vibrio chagasii]